MGGLSSVNLKVKLLRLMVRGRGVGTISSWAHSDSLVSVLDRNSRLALFTSSSKEPSDILDIFSARLTSSSAGRSRNALAGSVGFLLSILSLKTPESGPERTLSDQVLPD